MADIEELKQKYASVLKAMQQEGAKLENLNLDPSGKLFLRASAPSDGAANRIWDAIKRVDPNAPDLMADIKSLGGADQKAASGGETYTVQSGDTLSKISKQFYGDAGRYRDIFNANQDQLSDPDKIRPGQQLKIPAK